MTSPIPHDVVDRIAAALAATDRLIARVSADQWSAETPCPDWNVRTLVNHLVGGLRIYAAELTHTDAGRAHEDDWLGDHPIAAYRGAARAVLAAWRSPGAMSATLDLSVGRMPAPMAAVIELTEIVVHGLDLAVATGQEDAVDEKQAAAQLELMTGMGIDAFRVPGVFGPALPAPETAPVHLRLLAFLGRDVVPAQVSAGSAGR
jgi:uncharacterized protein (TIGR03086 family)